jgi:dihydrofolate reductase
VYRQFLPFADKLYITKVHKIFDADTFFPEIDEDEWKLIEREDAEPDEKNDFSFSYLTYTKKNQHLAPSNKKTSG